MPLKPFLGPAVGTDICQISRITRILLRKPIPTGPSALSRFCWRIFHPGEVRGLRKRFNIENLHTLDLADPARSLELKKISQYLAGRWAAKEAIIKATTWTKPSLKCVYIIPREDPIGVVLYYPRLYYLGRDEFEKASTEPLESIDLGFATQYLRGQVVSLSISHDGDYATAVCIAPSLYDLDKDNKGFTGTFLDWKGARPWISQGWAEGREQEMKETLKEKSKAKVTKETRGEAAKRNFIARLEKRASKEAKQNMIVQAAPEEADLGAEINTDKTDSP